MKTISICSECGKILFDRLAYKEGNPVLDKEGNHDYEIVAVVDAESFAEFADELFKVKNFFEVNVTVPTCTKCAFEIALAKATMDYVGFPLDRE